MRLPTELISLPLNWDTCGSVKYIQAPGASAAVRFKAAILSIHFWVLLPLSVRVLLLHPSFVLSILLVL